MQLKLKGRISSRLPFSSGVRMETTDWSNATAPAAPDAAAPAGGMTNLLAREVAGGERADSHRRRLPCRAVADCSDNRSTGRRAPMEKRMLFRLLRLLHLHLLFQHPSTAHQFDL